MKNTLKEFLQVLFNGPVGNGDELVILWGTEVKGEGHSDLMYVPRSMLSLGSIRLDSSMNVLEHESGQMDPSYFLITVE